MPALHMVGLVVSGALIGAAAGLPEEWGGVRVAYAAAGAIGGLVSWSFQVDPSWRVRIVSVMAGAAVGYYLTAALVQWIGISPSHGEGLAFVMGFLALPILAGFYLAAKMFERDPLKTFGRIRGRDRRGGDDD